MSSSGAVEAASGAIEGIDVEGVEAWFRANVADITPPLHFERLPGGHSNLTYRVTDGQGRICVLRRPPLGELLPSAHDMGREYRAIHALGPTAVPVPPDLGLCEDLSVTGARFYVMGFVDGRVLHEEADALAVPRRGRPTPGRRVPRRGGRRPARRGRGRGRPG